jgi:hypothetical protein
LVIATTWEAEMARVTVQGQPEQKVSKNLSQKQTRYVGHICNTSYTRNRSKRIAVQGWYRAKERDPLKNKPKQKD